MNREQVKRVAKQKIADYKAGMMDKEQLDAELVILAKLHKTWLRRTDPEFKEAIYKASKRNLL